MVIIKRLHSYMLQRFLPLLAMTFFICLFIVLMQFLWKSIDDLVGKGLEVSVIGELFFYAALTMVPMALPLAVLLASLMVFGNLGENFELTAMKASGISLFRIMKPLTIVMILIAIGAFFFQNNVLPVAQTKMWTLLFSVRQKTPEVEIPQRSFYDQIPNMNLYVERKNAETGMLYDMIIYDLSRGLDNTRVILADSGRFNFTEDKTRLYLHLYTGEMFENMRDNSMGLSSASSGSYLPFRRESFTEKEVYFPFDANFNRIDEGGIRSQYVGQNISELKHSIDSIGRQVDSIGNIYARDLLTTPYFGMQARSYNRRTGAIEQHEVPLRGVHKLYDVDSLFEAPDPGYAKSYVSQALAKAKRQQQDYQYRSLVLAEQAKLMRRHDIELERKFTLSFACIIFFFIGAPLGAIIKKGGLGTPLVISVLLFIVYYIIDNAGYKMARDGKVPVWEGIWLSSAVLLSLGVFLTYKAAGDSAEFKFDGLVKLFRRVAGREMPRALVLKEVHMTDVNPADAIAMLQSLLMLEEHEQQRVKRLGKLAVFARGPAAALQQPLNQLVDYLSNTDDNYVIALLNEYPFTPTNRRLAGMIGTTRRLLERFGATSDAADAHNTPDNESEHTS